MKGVNVTRVCLSSKRLRAVVRSCLTIALALAMLPLVPGGRLPVVQALPPEVNGLFFGDGDYLKYSLYNTSYWGSKLYSYLDGTNLYAALVVDRNVNDNVFDQGKTAYMISAGWQRRPASNLVNSEFAGFTLTCAGTTYDWQQMYAYRDTNNLWISDHLGPAGLGTPPAGIVSMSSFAWNINNYEAKAPGPYPWDMYVNGGTTLEDWKSPFDPANPDTVIGLEGYPATGPIGYNTTYEYEWPMVYEWKIDLTAACSGSTIYVFSGSSHHSPSKMEGEDDEFPPNGGELKDLGDLPSTYGTLLTNSGPYHTYIVGGMQLGVTYDAETDGQPSADATGDNALAANDEDGIVLVNPMSWFEGTNGGTVAVTFSGGSTGTNTAWLAIWFDWNYNGVFDPATETAIYQQVTWTGTSPTTQQFTFDIPTGGLPDSGGNLYYRARLFTAEPTALGGTSAFVGGYTGGEVEDYKYEVPTAVDMVSFRALGADKAAVLTWETASETENVGFNVYRSTWAGGAKVKVNAAMIPSLVAPGSPFGAAYEFVDDTVQNGRIYQYWLESVDIRGGTRTYGPAQAILIRRLMKVE